MSETYHIGQNVLLFTDFPYSDLYYKSLNIKEKLERLDEKIKLSKFKYLIAITANKFQKDTREILKKNRFKEIVTFYSSHEEDDETLTMYLKKQNKYEKVNKKVSYPDPLQNCSVSFVRGFSKTEDENNYGTYRIFEVIAKKKNESKIGLENNGFKRVKNTPIYFRLDKGYEF